MGVLTGATMVDDHLDADADGEQGGFGAVGGLSALEAADLQDDLLIASNDLDRLLRLLEGACDALLLNFSKGTASLEVAHAAGLQGPGATQAEAALAELRSAVTGLQFQDMATQLIGHTLRRLRSCSDRLAQSVMGLDEDGEALVEPPPNRHNPVTQDEMDAGSVELF